GASSTYELANQASYAVSMGTMRFGYNGARVFMKDALDATNSCTEPSTGATMASLTAGSGWTTDSFTSYDDTFYQNQAWVKGFLTADEILTGAAGGFTCTCTGCGENGPQHTSSTYAYRFSLHPAGGGKRIEFYQDPQEVGVTSTRTNVN